MSYFFQILQRRETLERRIVEWNVGLHWLAHHELLELDRFVEERDGGLHARRRLVVPEPAVDVQLLEVRERRQPAKLVLQRRRIHGDAREVQRMNTEIGRRQIRKIGNRLSLALEDDAPTHAKHPFRDHAIRCRADDGARSGPAGIDRGGIRDRWGWRILRAEGSSREQARGSSGRTKTTNFPLKNRPDVHLRLRFKG